MRKPRSSRKDSYLSHYHHRHYIIVPRWTHILFLILLFWATYLFALGLATKRSMTPNTNRDRNNGDIPPIPLVTDPRGNTLRDRIYYPASYYIKKNTNDNSRPGRNNRQGGSSVYLRTDDNDESIYSPSSGRNRGFTSLQSSPVHNTANLRNRKLFEQKTIPITNSRIRQQSYEHDNRLSTVISPLSSGSGWRDKKKSYPPRPASVNSILRLDPSSTSSFWGDEATSVCHTIPGLTKDQMQLCFKNPDATKVALQGLNLAADECAYQMSKNRWNCSALQGRVNPHNTVMFRKEPTGASFSSFSLSFDLSTISCTPKE